MKISRTHGVICIFMSRFSIVIKTPRSQKLFSERYGYAKPILSLFGFRVFIRKLGSVK